MRLTSLELRNFRNYTALKLDFTKELNVFYGANGQGKTNILEGIYVAALGFSFRTRKDEELATFGRLNYLTELKATEGGQENTFTVRKAEKKEYFLNGGKVTPREYYGNLPLVLFAPDDLALVKGDPSLRRRYLDMQISQTSQLYLLSLLRYKKILAQRNSLLKQIITASSEDLSLLAMWDERLALEATNIVLYRLNTVEKLATIATSIYNELAGGGEELSLTYEVKSSESFLDARQLGQEKAAWQAFYVQQLHKRRTLDLLRKSTSVGPHRDELVLKLNGQSLKVYGSQGQQRSGALALKLAEIMLLKEQSGIYPLLLLDDVLSELDNSRRQKLMRFIKGKVQTFITLNDKELLQNVEPCTYYQVDNARVRKEE